ncbi:single-stranded DNA-binding protein [Paraburkholderia sediminicola]|uniref:single-stranded DNA-binding protein n=1 Tax=Paraburkholderia sediminicola TaxID=458836 RepID=UPI0038BDEB65
MSQSKNLCIFIGNVGADPEVRYLPSGDAVASFSLAVTEKWKDKQSGEIKESTEWIRISAFRRLAEVISEYVKKGAKLYIEGKFKTRKYQAQDGTDRYSTEIVAEQMIMLGGGQGGEGGGERRERSSGNSGGNSRKPSERQGQKAGSAAYGAGGGFDSMDDDIPFAPPYRGLQWLVCA